MSLIDVMRECERDDDKHAWLRDQGIDGEDFILLLAEIERNCAAGVASGTVLAEDALMVACAAAFQVGWVAARR